MDSRIIVKRGLPALLVMALLPVAGAAQSDRLVSLRNLTPYEYRSRGFVLAAAQDVRIVAVGAEPAPEKPGRENEWSGPEEERDVWPAAAWIVNARTRAVVWDLRTVRTASDEGLHRFDSVIHLPAGVYEAHYASYAAASVSFVRDGNLREIVRGLARGDMDSRYGGPYVDNGAFREFQLVISGKGHPASESELAGALRAFQATAIARVTPDGPDSIGNYGFQLNRPTTVTVTALGEVRHDDPFDYAWIMNADTRERVWTMSYDRSRAAGGARKNRIEDASLSLPAGRYVAYFATDASHQPGGWNAVPPFDPGQWGLTLRVADAAARAAVRPFVYEPVPTGQTIVSLTGIGDDAMRSAGFALKQPLLVRIYALGEGTDDQVMHDYAWIIDANTRRRVWTMTYGATAKAGGADKNRLFDDTLRLAAGSYLVYYRSDGSHSAEEWNATRPPESRYWGVSVFPASGRLNKALIGPVERSGGRKVLAELPHMGNQEEARKSFRLDKEAAVRIFAVGEGSGGEMFDYAWIEASSGQVVWEMTYRTSEHAGGAEKNRMFDGTIRLPAGNYLLRYKSDGSHSYEEWNSDAPDDPDAWGVVVSLP